MSQSVLPTADVVFRDALGERRRTIDSTGAEAEVLCVSAELSRVPTFEEALTRTVGRLTEFHHPSFPTVRGVERVDPATLSVTCDAVHGVRLSRLLTSIVERGIALELGAALCVTRQIVSAIDALHHRERDLSHGAVGPERIVISSNARVLVADHMLGSALEQLRYSHQHYWKSLRIALPRSAGITKFDHHVDVTQIGSTALALVLGRMLRDDEYSGKLVDLINSTEMTGSGGELMPLKPELREWLLRCIQVDPLRSFSSAAEAGAMLDTLQSDSERAAGMASLDRVLMRHHGVAPPPVVVKPVVSPTPIDTHATPPIAKHVEPAAPVVSHFERPVVAPMVAHVERPALAPIVPHVERPAAVPIVAHIEPPVLTPMSVPPFATPLPHSGAAAAIAPPPLQAVRLPNQQAGRWQRIAVAAVVLAALTGGGLFLVRRRALATALSAATGTLTVQSNPSGVPLDVDGKASGFTPATLTVQGGTHTIVLRGAGEPRTMTVSVNPGSQVSQYIEFAKTAPKSTGGLLVRTEPAGALVTVDRVTQGASPATIPNLSPGDHTVVVSSDGVSVEQIVTVEAGVTSSLVVPLGARDRASMSGWVAISAPIDVQIFESGKLLGTNQTDRVMVSTGEHHLDFVNDALGYRSSRTLTVKPGKVDNVSLKVPSGSIALNAVPWAEVWIDGEKAGDTPIGNLTAAIGRHDVVFRHPDLGETRQSVMVTLLAPARLSVDMRKK